MFSTDSVLDHVTGAYERLFTLLEQGHDGAGFTHWMRGHWTDSLLYGLVYLALVVLTRRYARSRGHGWSLGGSLFVWNAALCVFSAAGALRTAPGLLRDVWWGGAERALCDSAYFSGPRARWAQLFALSKVVELGDTAFIVLRMRPLSVLHCYHHVTVLVYTWYSMAGPAAPARCFAVLNYSVHALMYAYYAARSRRWVAPRFISITLTSLQMAQMVVGICVNMVTYRALSAGRPCQQTWTNWLAATLMYLSYLVLFANFFYQTYLVKKNPGKKLKASVSASSNGSSNTSSIANSNASSNTSSIASSNGNGNGSASFSKSEDAVPILNGHSGLTRRSVNGLSAST